MTTIRASFAAALVLLLTAGSAWAQAPGTGESKFSTSAEYLLWWAKDSPASPPLLGNDAFGAPGFSAALGGQSYDTGAQSGGRFSIGYRFTPEWSVEGIGFFLPAATVTKSVSSSGAPGSPRLLVPQFLVDGGGEGTLTIADPGNFFGTARESLRSDLNGAELNVTRKVMAGANWRLDALGGFRYMRLKETLTFSASSVAIGAPDIFNPTDSFATDNQFYGAQLGVKGEYTMGNWFANGSVKLGLGVMRESVDIAGTLQTNDFNPTFGVGAPQTFVGGMFAQPSNIGSHSRDRFAVVPEVGLKLGYRLTSWASIFVGYNFLYASAVVRPGSQIDRNLNTTQSMAYQTPQSPPPTLTLQGDARPSQRFRESDYWVQGLTAGVSFGF